MPCRSRREKRHSGVEEWGVKESVVVFTCGTHVGGRVVGNVG
jgi:hypothetical protein